MKSILLIDHGSRRRRSQLHDGVHGQSRAASGGRDGRRAVRAHGDLASRRSRRDLRPAWKRARRGDRLPVHAVARHGIPRATSRAWSAGRGRRPPRRHLPGRPSAFGVHEHLADVILARAGHRARAPAVRRLSRRCWDPAHSRTAPAATPVGRGISRRSRQPLGEPAPLFPPGPSSTSWRHTDHATPCYLEGSESSAWRHAHH